MSKYNGGDENGSNPRKKGNSNVKRHFDKMDNSKDKQSKYTYKERGDNPRHDENPLEDMEILRAMGMERCNDCNHLYPVYLNRCPNCKDK